MIVDKDPASSGALALLLDPEFDAIIAASGGEALALASEAMPDLILLDIIMPDMDGYELCTLLKADAQTAPIPIIFITGLKEPELESHGLELGAADYLTRPFNAAVVRARVRNNIELKLARDRLLALAETDGLTGLFNRRAFDAALDREWKRLARSRAAMSIIMLDVDHFKAFNDTYGHVAGDACLKAIAGVLNAHMQRPADMAARYGGEEFVCLLPDTALDAAVELAQRINDAIGALAIAHSGSAVSPHVTVSSGVATATWLPGIDGGSLLTAADACLYRAKHDGRNRVGTKA